MNAAPRPAVLPADDDWRALKEAVTRFEAAWRQGLRPVIDAHLPAEGLLRRALLVELAHLDLELRLKAGETARVEEYLARYPELAGDGAITRDLVLAEYELRQRTDPALDPDDYLRRFPQHQADLAPRLLPVTRFASRVGRDTPRNPATLRAESPPRVPGYEVLGLLGRGGMGVVYRARQLSLYRLVALKVLPEDCAHDPVWLERFRREGRTASALNDPHICTIYDSGEFDGRPFLSMELIEGQTLDALLGRRPGAEELARLIGQAARALAAAHAAGVVHRDVKPQNLMVRGDGLVKVLDFGLARPPGVRRFPLDPGASGSDPGGRVGTVRYMSPEQARAEPVGPATDVFSLGIVLYELATGQHPFAAGSEVGGLHAVESHTPLAPALLNPEIPAALDGLTLRMLARDPRLRPSAAEVDAALTELMTKGADRRAGGPLRLGQRLTVGRQVERAALRAAFQAAAAGQGGMVCVTGEPGLGKTTLVEGLLDELAAGGWNCSLARGRCSERLAGAEAYLPFLEALDNLLQGPDGASAAHVLRLLAPTWYVQLVPQASQAPDAVLVAAREASPERRKRELGAFFQENSRRRPFVLFLDDIHWADPSSVDLLAYLGGKCAGLRLCLLLTYRPSDLRMGGHPFGQVKLELQGRGVCREVALSFLSRDDFDRYLALAFPGHRFPIEFADVVHARTEGNPLFMVDLLRYLRDQGTLVEENGQWTLTRRVQELLPELPESVRGLIQRKVDQLDPEARRLLMAASVQGREFDAAVVARLLGQGAADVEERLDFLERVHVLVRLVREHEFPDGTPTLRYAFVHVLYQNAFYASVRPTRKAAWSAAAADALLDHYGQKSAAVATELALLFEAARDPERAIPYCLQAARNAVGVAAHQEAALLARRGLALLAKLPDTAARDVQELPLLLSLGVSLVATTGFASPEVEQTYERARALCQRGDDLSTLVPVLYGLWNLYLVRCDLVRCTELAGQMSALAAGQADPVYRLLAHNVQQQPCFHRGDFGPARAHQEQALALYELPTHRGLTDVYGEDPGVGCLAYGAATLWQLGYADQALRSLEAGRRLAEDLSNPFNVAQVLYYGALTHLCRRDEPAARALAEALRELCEEQGFALLLAGAQVLLGRLGSGQGDDALRQMRQGLADWQATGAWSHRPYHLALLAEALIDADQLPKAETALAEARTITETTGERFWEAELRRLQGELHARRAETELAEACLRRAADVARRQGARALELRALVGLARSCRPEGKLAEARTALAEAYAWFTEGFDTADLREAKELLDGRAQT
jgi:predicted ATPase